MKGRFWARVGARGRVDAIAPRVGTSNEVDSDGGIVVGVDDLADIRVLGSGSVSYKLLVRRTMQVSALKALIMERVGIPCGSQRLHIAGRDLIDNDALHQCNGVSPFETTTLQIVVRGLRGTMEHGCASDRPISDGLQLGVGLKRTSRAPARFEAESIQNKHGQMAGSSRALSLRRSSTNVHTGNDGAFGEPTMVKFNSDNETLDVIHKKARSSGPNDDDVSKMGKMR